MHHLIIIDIHAYQAERVAQLLDLQGVSRDGHVSFVGCCSTLGEVEASLRLCLPRKPFIDFPMHPLESWHLECSRACDHEHMSPSNTLRGLHPCRVFGSRFNGLVYVRSFDVAPIALSDKVLVHLVLPRCEVVSIQLLGWESAPHLSIDYVDSSSSSLFECELCSKATIAMSRFLVVGVGHSARVWATSSYQTALIPCKES